jgi:hypothetical protein
MASMIDLAERLARLQAAGLKVATDYKGTRLARHWLA